MNGNTRDRRNWTRSLTVVLLVAVIGTVIVCLADVEDVKTDRVYLRNTAGAVLFDHGKHGNNVDSCVQCHHDLYAAAPAPDCKECHDEEFVADDYDHSDLKEIHSRDCSTCHEQVDDDKQAVSCRECHSTAQQSEKQTKSCADWHDDSYVQDMMEHDEYMETGDHSCLGCHSPQALSVVYHTNCSNCHTKTLPDRFAKPGGDVLCGACHLP